MKKISRLTMLAAVVLAGFFASNTVFGKDKAEKMAEKMAKWQAKAQTHFDMTFDKFMNMSIISSKPLWVCRSPVIGTPKPAIDLVVSLSYKGVEMLEKPKTLDLILICYYGEKGRPYHGPAAPTAAIPNPPPNPHNALAFLADDQGLPIEGEPVYKINPANYSEVLQYKVSVEQYAAMAGASVLRGRLGSVEFDIKDFDLVVLKEMLNRLNAVK